LWSILGRFSVRFEDDSGDDWMMILGGVFEDDFRVLFWAIFQVRHLLMDCVPVYVSDHREPVFERFCQIPCAMPCWLKQDLLNDVLGRFLTGAILHVLLVMIFGAVFELVFTPFLADSFPAICLYSGVWGPREAVSDYFGRSLRWIETSTHSTDFICKSIEIVPEAGIRRVIWCPPGQCSSHRISRMRPRISRRPRDIRESIVPVLGAGHNTKAGVLEVANEQYLISVATPPTEFRDPSVSDT
jgi:hypothetical protein